MQNKETVFDAAETLDLMLAAMTGMVGDLTVNAAAMRAAASSGYSTATDLADWLVREAGLPFREAHHVAGHAVALASQEGAAGQSLRWKNCRTSTRRSRPRCIPCFHRARRKAYISFGGTAPQVRRQIRH